MKKKELIDAIAEEMGTTKKDARVQLDGVFKVVGDALAKGETVPLGELGKFEVVHRASRKGHNPQTGKEITIPARKAVKYKPSKHAKELVN